MSGNTKTKSLLYNSIVVEKKREIAFAEWREKVELFKCLFHGAGMSLINNKFRPWKAPGLKRKQSYKKFLQCYKYYYAAKKVLRDLLNELIFHDCLHGERLTTAFGDALVQLDRLSKIYTELDLDVTKVENSPNTIKEVQLMPVDDKPNNESNEGTNEERSSSGDSLGTPGHESHWNYNDNISYDSDDAYDTNMFPGYGRSPQVSTGPTFTYDK